MDLSLPLTMCSIPLIISFLDNYYYLLFLNSCMIATKNIFGFETFCYDSDCENLDEL